MANAKDMVHKPFPRQDDLLKQFDVYNVDFKINTFIYLGRGVKMLHTYMHTYRASDEAGPRGAFAP